MGVLMVPPWKDCSWWNEKCLEQCLTLGIALDKHHLSIIITILDMTTCKYRLSLPCYSLKFRVWFWSQLEFKHQPRCFDEPWGWLSFSASLDVSLPDLWDGEDWCDAVTQENVGPAVGKSAARACGPWWWSTSGTCTASSQPGSTFTWALRPIDLTFWKPVQSISVILSPLLTRLRNCLSFPWNVVMVPPLAVPPPLLSLLSTITIMIFLETPPTGLGLTPPKLLIMHTQKMTLEHPMGPEEESGIHWLRAQGCYLGPPCPCS